MMSPETVCALYNILIRWLIFVLTTLPNEGRDIFMLVNYLTTNS